MKIDPKRLRLYAVTDRAWTHDAEGLLRQVAAAVSVEEALAAQAAGADYLGVGAAFVTGTKTDAKPISRETIRAITAAVDIPVVAIGGISHDNILELKNCGLDGVAVVSALFAQADVKAAAEELLRLSEEIAR